MQAASVKLGYPDPWREPRRLRTERNRDGATPRAEAERGAVCSSSGGGGQRIIRIDPPPEWNGRPRRPRNRKDRYSARAMKKWNRRVRIANGPMTAVIGSRNFGVDAFLASDKPNKSNNRRCKPKKTGRIFERRFSISMAVVKLPFGNKIKPTQQ